MFDWYKKVVFENYANFNGRARRSEYWYFTLMNLIFSLATMFIDKALGIKFGFNSLYSLAIFLPGLAVSVRRLHDIGKSGWLLLIFYIVFIISIALLMVAGVGLFTGKVNATSFGAGLIIPTLLILALAIWLLVMYCTNGDVGTNKYGPDPKSDGLEDINQIGNE